jgi:predicted transposase YbfD/YdcC
LRRTLARLDPQALEEAFVLWTASLARRINGVEAIDGKTVRGSKRDADGKGALHLMSAWAHEAGLILATAKATRSPPSRASGYDRALEGAIVTIDAMGTQKRIAAKIVAKKADYVLAPKGNQGTVQEDAALFFADPVLTADCPCHEETDSGHGRIEERSVRTANAAWLVERHPEWKGLASIVSVTVRRTIKKTGATSTETRLFISSLPPDPLRLATAVRAHWSVENNLHWVLDVTFREDACRVRKNHSARNLATIRRAVLNSCAASPPKARSSASASRPPSTQPSAQPSSQVNDS